MANLRENQDLLKSIDADPFRHQEKFLSESIKSKKSLNKDQNEFLNSLTPDEFQFYVENNKKDGAKFTETGVKSEFVTDQAVELSNDEKSPEKELTMNEVDKLRNIERKLEKELKVFNDVSYFQFLQIFGLKFDPELPLFA